MAHSYQEEFLELINREEEPSMDELEAVLEEMHPIDTAAILDEIEEDDRLNLLLKYDDKEFLADVLEQADDTQQTRIVSLLDYPSIIELFSYMSKDDIADILGDLAFGVRKSLLNLMKRSDSRELQVLLGYDEDTAGGIMTTEYIGVFGDLTMEAVLNKIREIAPKTEVIEFIFVLNEHRQLVGVADLRDILTAPSTDNLYSIMNENVISVYPEEDQEAVAHLVSKYDLNVVPVINHRQALLGIITVDDIIDVMVEEQTEDILRMGGVNEEEKIGGPFFGSIRKRLPWLCVNLLTAFIAAYAVRLFEDVIAQVVALAMAMTVVSGMGGNAGTQTLSLVIRGITLGEIDIKKDWQMVFKEIGVGLLNGAIIGIIAGIVMYVIYGNWYLGLVIFIAMVGNLFLSALFGFLIPLLIKKFGGDPALASTIFLTTITDTGGFILFLGVAKLFLPHLT